MSRPSTLQDYTRLVTEAVLRAADPGATLEGAWLDPSPGPVFLAAFGKASAEMAAWAAQHLGDRLTRGIVIGVPERLARVRLPAQVQCLEADHPLPSERNVHAAATLLRELGAFARAANGTVVCLISGGGSAHLTLPAPGLTLDDLRSVSSDLQRAGAPIHDLNAVRKHTELLKGGRLAAAAAPACIEAYILSDVIGDRLDVIASGPTAPDPTTFAQALAVIERWNCREASRAVVAQLESGAAGNTPETPKPGDLRFSRVRNTVIASNQTAVEGARAALVGAGVSVASVELGVEGDAASAGRRLAQAVAHDAGAGPAAWIMGGEPTVRVGTSTGRGGPSQELALACAIELDSLGLGERSGVIAFSSDGIDGPTDAAGAALTAAEIAGARTAGLNPDRALSEHVSHTFLDRLGVLIRTGPTGTNVNHIAVGLLLA